MRFEDRTIYSDKVLNNLDRFVIHFINVFEKHSEYVLVSGYVSILLGRSRISEDVDLLFPRISKIIFMDIHQELIHNGFWCLNSDNTNEIYGLLDARHSIRYGINKNPFPNMEIKFAKTRIDEIALSTKITVRLPTKDINISDLNLQVAFKEQILGSKKDLEDAMHIRRTFKEQVEDEKIQTYKEMMK